MKGINFYLEYSNKRDKRKGTRKDPGNHRGTVVAVATKHERGHWTNFPDFYLGNEKADAIGALFNEPNSVVCSCSVCPEYLDEKCKRISEALAREIHPQLFEYLDYAPFAPD